MSDPHNQRTWHVLFWVWATFFLFGAVTAPVPGVNEPHYLCKARHFWQPDWYARDFFLDSPNAHTVFYSTIGSLTTVVSLTCAAWIGRILATLILAWGWTSLQSRLFFTRWAPLWSAWIFLEFSACGNFSGEWLSGGVEGKVFSYGLLFAAMGDVLRDRWLRAAAWTGIAISFHPVVGIWGLFAFVASRMVQFVVQWCRNRHLVPVASDTLAPTSEDISVALKSPTSMWQRCISPRVIGPLLILILLTLPGLVPVIRLLMEPVSDDIRYTATYLQVYFRLAHHLDPMKFPSRAYWGYTFLLAIWISGLKWGGRTNSTKAFDHVVAWSIVFAVAGIAIGFGPRPAQLMPWFAERMQLLKFYPFRLGDVLLPMAVAVSLVSVLERTALYVPSSPRSRLGFAWPHAAMLFVLLGATWSGASNSETNRYATADRADWLNVCQWIDEHLPGDAVVQSPINGWAFKWFARRAEYVAFKDCPQNAAGIVEWNRRLNFLHQWYEEKYADSLYSADELRGLQRDTGITHLLTDRLGPLDLDPIFRNGTFQVYDLGQLNPAEKEKSGKPNHRDTEIR